MIFACAKSLGPEIKIHFGVHKNMRICNVFLRCFFLFFACAKSLGPEIKSHFAVFKTTYFVSFFKVLLM
jgi:hypothetical protein